MLKCNINRHKKKQWTKGTGTPADLMVETAALIGTGYKYIRQECPDAAQPYKHELIGLLLDPASPVWKGE